MPKGVLVNRKEAALRTQSSLTKHSHLRSTNAIFDVILTPYLVQGYGREKGLRGPNLVQLVKKCAIVLVAQGTVQGKVPNALVEGSRTQ